MNDHNAVALPGKERSNILFVMLQMAMGGSERLIHSLVRRLDRNRYAPHIAWFYGEEILREFRDLQVPLFHIPKLKRFDFSTMRRLSEIIRDNHIHVVNAHHFMSMVYAFYGCKIRNSAKLIYTEHSQWEIDSVPWRWKQIGTHLLNRADGVVGVTDGVTEKLRSYFRLDETRCVTIGNGVDLDDYSHLDRRQIIRRELGLSDDVKVIGMVANFKRIKNHKFLLEAFKKLTESVDSVKLMFVGQGFRETPDNTESELRHFVTVNGLTEKVLFLGYRSDVPDLLAAVDIFCLTSLNEGMPISLIEAMAAGLPIVGTNVPGIRDLVKPGKNGFLLEIGDVEGLRNILRILVQDDLLKNKLGAECKSIAKNEFSLIHSVKRYESLFE